jgi:hypothetical protein
MRFMLILLLTATGAAAQTRTVWSENFETHDAQSSPASWLDASGRFRIHPDGENMVYGAQHPSPKQRSARRRGPADVPEGGVVTTLSGRTFTGRDGFELRGRFRRMTAESLAGVTFFSRQPETDTHHMVALWRSGDGDEPVMGLYRRTDGLRELDRSDFTPAVGVWYRFLIRADRQTGGGVLRARVWRDGEEEPDAWLLQAVEPDLSAPSGRIGLWSAYGAAYFDDLSVSAEVEEEVDRLGPAIFFSESDASIAHNATAAFNRDARVDIRALDASGVASVTATLDDAPYPPLSVIAGEKRYVLKARALDKVGNASEASISVVIDKTPPTIRILDGGSPMPEALLVNRNVELSVDVEDASETSVSALLDDQNFASGTQVSAEGTHRFAVSATDAVGWTSTAARTFTIDRTPPSITITSPSNETHLGAATVDVQGTSGDAVRVDVNGLPAVLEGGAFRRAGVPVGEGPNSIVVTGSDAAGNTGRAEVRVHRDTRAPEVLVLSPAPNVCVSATELVIRGTFRDAKTISVRFAQEPAVSAAITGTDWTATVPVPAEGPGLLVVEAVDESGFRAQVALPIAIDRTKPRVELSEGGVAFTGTLFNRPVSPQLRVVDADRNASLSATINGTPFVAGGVLREDGSYTLRANAVDCAGNAADPVESTFTIDRTPPRIVSIAPAAGATVGAKTAVTGTLTEPATVVDEESGLAASVDGAAFSLPLVLAEGENERILVITDPAGNVSRTPYSVRLKTGAPFVEITESGTVIPPEALFSRLVTPVVRVSDPGAKITASLNGAAFVSGTAIGEDGRYTLTANAIDQLGHVSDSVSATFTIDRTPPRIEITAPSDGARLAADRIAVSGTVDADVVAVDVNGVRGVISGTAFKADIVLDAGSNLIVAKAADRAGNIGRDRIEIARDAGPLALFLTSPPDQMLTNRPTAIVAGQVLTQPPSGTVRVNDGEIRVDAGGAFRKVDFALVEGENEIVATVTNGRGETTSVAVGVIADFTPPVLRVTANGLALGDGARFRTSPAIAVEASDNIPQGLSTELIIDGAPVIGPFPSLANGGHALTSTARDAAGNETRIDRTFFVGDARTEAGCGLSALDPPDGTAVFADFLRITGRSGGAAGVLIDGKAAFVADGSFCGEAQLQAGRNEIVIQCADGGGTPTADAPVTLVIHRDGEPAVTITSPSGDSVANGTIEVKGTVSAGVVSAEVNGIPAAVTGTSFVAPGIVLSAGLNTIVARVRTGSGRTAVDTAAVTLRNAAPQLAITSPIAGTETGSATVDVTGTFVHVDPATIVVNGVPAATTALTDTSGTFRGASSLAPGLVNTIVAAGRNHVGVEARSEVEVRHVANAPSIAITGPADNAFVGPGDVQVTGTIGAPDGSQVTVNGVPVSAAGGTFATSVKVAAGTSPLIARVTTPSGEDAMDSIRVTRADDLLAIRESFPAAGATGVDPGVAVILLFNRVVDVNAIDAGLRVTDSAGNPVGGRRFIDREAVTFAPSGPLHANETYTIAFGASSRVFTTAATAPTTAPVVDDVATSGCFSSVTLTGRATPGARVRVEADRVTQTTSASGTGAFKLTVTFSGQSGFHIVRVREAGSDGSLSPERAVCFRTTCELPRVISAMLDRSVKTLRIEFSRPMNPSTLVVGTTIVTEPALTGTVTVTGSTATVVFAEEIPPVQLTLTVRQGIEDLDGASPASDYTQAFAIDSGLAERGKGYVSGAVYDATTGRPLPGAVVTIDSIAAPANDRGRYSRALAEGAYTIAVAAEGYTPAWRQVVVPAGAGVVPIDIRLTRRNTSSSSGGDTTVTRRVEVAGAERVTSVGGQSLPGLLPLGWSPLAAAEVLGSGPGASLTFHTGAATRALTVVRYDEARDEWRVLIASAVPADGKVIAFIPGSGHFAAVYPDEAPHLSRPPVPIAGDALQGVTNPCPDEPAKCTLTSRAFTLEPRAILPNGRAVATLVTDGATQPYPSGTAVQATIDEQLNLADGRVLIDPPFATDLLLYRTLAGDAAVAEFHLAPSSRAAAVTLRDGVERIRFVEYPGRMDRGTLLGAEGGRVPGDGRVTIDVPSGAAPEPLHASTASLPQTELDGLGPIAGFRIAGGFSFTLTRATAGPKLEGVSDVEPSLLIPARATFSVANAGEAQVIVAEAVAHPDFGVVARVVAIADRVDGSLFATRSIDSTALPIDGIVRDGRYLILSADAPVAFAYGIVRAGATRLAIADSRVAANGLGVSAVTPRSGLFVLPVLAKPAPPFELVARTASAGDGTPAVAQSVPDAGAFVDFGDLLLLPKPPALRGVTPDGGEVSPTAGAVVRAEFDSAIDPTSVVNAIRLTHAPTGTAVTGSVSAAGNNVTFTGAEPLQAASQYSVTIMPSIRAVNGAAFGRTVVRSFRTASIPGNGTVRAELVRIHLPDANGVSRIYGEPGALPSGAQAVAVRRDRDFVVRYQATAAPDGSFSFLAGSGGPSDRITLSDLIDLHVVDAVSRGVVGVVPLTPFASEDLRTFVASPTSTTVFLTADGIRAAVPAGAFSEPTAITVKRAGPSAFASVPKFEQEIGFGAAVELTFDGIAQKRIDLVVPVPEGVTTSGRNWLVGHLGQSIRGPRVMVVDLAYEAGGRFFTGVASAGGTTRIAGNAAITGPELRAHLLGVQRSGVFALIDLRPGTGPVAFGLLDVFQHGYDLFWDSFESLFAAHFYLAEAGGRIAIPVVMGTAFSITGVDAATGLERFTRAYDPIAVGDPGSVVPLPAPNDDREGPYPVTGSPFRIEPIDVIAQDSVIESVRNFTVKLANGVISASPEAGFARPAAMLNVARGMLDPSVTGGLSVDGSVGDRVVLLIGEENVDPDALLSVTFSEPIAAQDPSPLFRVTLDGVPIEVRPRFDAGKRRIIFDHSAALMRGKTYRLEISPELADASGLRIGQIRDSSGVVSAPLSEPLYLHFKVREPAGKVASFDLQEGLIRDQALVGNVLLVSALDAGIYAYDVSNPAAAGAVPIGHHSGEGTSYWALAHDPHGRIFATGMTSMMGVVRTFRLEDFHGNLDVEHRGATSVSFNPGTAAALNIASRVIASDRPEAIPRRIQVLVSDREVPYQNRADFKTSGGATVSSVMGDFEELRVEIPFNPSLPYAVQRVTVVNTTLDMRWSADAMFGQPARIAGILARKDDRLSLLANESTYAVISLLGFGISVVDMNAVESNDAPVKKPDYAAMRELVRLTNGKSGPDCPPVADYAIPNLEFTPDAGIRPASGSPDLDVFALDPHRGVLDLRIRPPRNASEAELPPDRLICEERLSGTGLVLRNSIPVHDHPRLAKLRDLYQARTARLPQARFNAAAMYSWKLDAKDNSVVSPANGPGTFDIGQRGSRAGEAVRRDYMLIPAFEYGLLVVEVGGDAPAANLASAPPLHDDHLVDLVWIPAGCTAVRTVAGTDLAVVTDGGGHVLLIDLSRLDERWGVAGDELFPTVRAILESNVETPDPRILWRSKEPLASGTLAPVVDPATGMVYAGKLLETTTNVVSAFDPRLQMRAERPTP